MKNLQKIGGIDALAGATANLVGLEGFNAVMLDPDDRRIGQTMLVEI